MKILIIIPIVFLSFTAGCASQAPPGDYLDSPDHTRAQLLSGEAILGRAVAADDLPDEPVLQLSAEMRQLLDKVPPGAPQQRLNFLIQALQQQGFSVYYQADATLPAAQVFSEQRANCIAYAAMMVAMARYLGAEVHFNQVMVPPSWHLENDQAIVYQHINMVVESPQGRQIVDFNLANYSPRYRQQPLSDAQAMARFYGNRAVELMQRDNPVDAFLYARKALELAPSDADLWNNLGAVYSRAQLPEQAASVYRTALEIDAGNPTALSNLERVLRNSGQLAAAARLSKQVERHRQGNPYYWYFKAVDAYQRGEFDTAIDSAEDAIRREKSDHRFHFLLGMARYRAGLDYRDEFQAAVDLAGSDSDGHRYQKKMALLGEDISPSPVRVRRTRPGNAPIWWGRPLGW